MLDDDEMESVNFDDALQRFNNEIEKSENLFYTEEELDSLYHYFFARAESEKASIVAEKGISLYPFSIEFKLYKANLLLWENAFKETLEYIEGLKSYYSEEPEIYKIEGMVFFNRQEYTKAINAFRTSLRLDPDAEETLLVLATAYARTGKMDAAISLLNEFFLKNPDNEFFIFQVFDVFVDVDKYKEMEKLLNKWIDLYPYNPNIWSQLGKLYQITEEYEKALKAYDYAHLCDEDNDQTLLQIASVYEDIELYEKAIEVYKDIQLNFGNEGYLNFYIGRCYSYIDKIEQARYHFRLSIDKDPSMADSWYFLGMTYFDEDRFDKALPYLNKAMQLDLWDPECRIAVGVCYFELKELVKGDEMFENLSKQFPDYYKVWLCWAKGFMVNDMYNKAERLLQHIPPTVRNKPDIIMLEAALLFHNGETALCFVLAEKAMEGNRESAYTLLDLQPEIENHDKMRFLIALYQIDTDE